MFIVSPGLTPFVVVMLFKIPSSYKTALKYPSWSYLLACAVIITFLPWGFSIDKIWIQPDIYVVDSPYTSKDEVLEIIWLQNN